MRFYHTLTLSTLIIVYLLSDNVLGDQGKGNYMWLKCEPDGNNANCLEKKGPPIDITGSPRRLPASVVKDMDPFKSSETEESEESGDGSGDFLRFPFNLRRTSRNSGQQQIQNEVEGSGADFAYPIYKTRTPVKLTEEDLRRDNIID